MPQPTSDAVLRAGADSARIAAAAVDAARDPSRQRHVRFNSQPALEGIVPGLPVPSSEAPTDAMEPTLEVAVNLPLRSYDPLSRQYVHLSRALTQKCITLLEQQIAAAEAQLLEFPDTLARANCEFDEALAAHQQAQADLANSYRVDWNSGTLQWGDQGITSTMAVLTPDATMKDGRPLSETIPWRRAQRFQERLAAAQRTVTRLSAREPDLRHALGIWVNRLGELRANLAWWAAQDRELGLEA